MNKPQVRFVFNINFNEVMICNVGRLVSRVRMMINCKETPNQCYASYTGLFLC